MSTMLEAQYLEPESRSHPRAGSSGSLQRRSAVRRLSTSSSISGISRRISRCSLNSSEESISTDENTGRYQRTNRLPESQLWDISQRDRGRTRDRANPAIVQLCDAHLSPLYLRRTNSDDTHRTSISQAASSTSTPIRRANSDPNLAPGTNSYTSYAPYPPAAKPSHPRQRPLTYTVQNAHPVVFHKSGLHPPASPPRDQGYLETDLLPLRPPSSLTIPPPLLEIQQPTPLACSPETFHAKLVRASRKKMSEALLAQRKERRRSGSPLWLKLFSSSRTPSPPIAEDLALYPGLESPNAEEMLQEWERELRDQDAMDKLRSWEQSRKRDAEFKEWERRQRSELARRSIQQLDRRVF